YALHVFLYVEIDIRVAKVELESRAQIRIPRAALDFVERIVAERIDRTEPDQTRRVRGDLRADPVVLRANSGVLVRARVLERVGESVGVGKNHRAVDAGDIHLLDQIRGRDCLGSRKNGQRLRAD